MSLVGAGPGDPDLISVKGLKALINADVVLYDALVSEELLAYAPVCAEKVFVGKRAGKHSFSQDEINRMLAENAFRYDRVVRLKGGDPFVFGRGHEELQYLVALGIEVDIIPGISSTISVPALQGIPVTKRGISQGFWAITGTDKNGKLSKDLDLAAQSDATVLVLMGLGKLDAISAIYRSYDRGHLPAAVISNGSLPNEKAVYGTIDSIADAVREHNIPAPAIIAIGEVVRERPGIVFQHISQQSLQSQTFQN